jgi:hypothetical protein
MGGGAVVAAAAAAHRRRLNAILDAFRLADATAPERARTLDALGVSSSRELDALTQAGVLLAAPRAGAWYLNEKAYVAYRDERPRRTLRIIGVVILVLLLGLGLLLVYPGIQTQ